MSVTSFYHTDKFRSPRHQAVRDKQNEVLALMKAGKMVEAASLNETAIIYMTKQVENAHQSGDRPALISESEISRKRNVVALSLADALQRILGGSTIEHSAYSLQYIADEVLETCLSAAIREGLVLRGPAFQARVLGEA